MSLAELVKLNDQRLSDEEVSALNQKAKFLSQIAVVPASNGTNHRYLKTSTASSAAFRDLDSGLAKTKSARTQVDVAMKVLDASFDVDKAEADAFVDGPSAYLEKELKEAIAESFFSAEEQIFYGTGADANGFAGLAEDALYSNVSGSAYTVEPTTAGTTADSQTSVWVVHSSEKELAYVAGNGGNITFDADEPTIIEKIEDPTTNGNSYPAYYVPVLGWGGVQKGSGLNIVRICNIENDFDDDDIANAVGAMKDDPTHIVMNRKARRLLQQSRTATNGTGAPAPRPVEWEGIPIVETNAISSTEAVVS